RGAPVPAPERCRQRRHDDPYRRPAPSEVVVVKIPDVAHRGKAIAQVEGPRRRPRTLRDAVAHRHHEVIARQVEAVDRQRKQGQIVAVARGRTGQALDERGDDAAVLDDGAHAARNVQEREERRGREKLAEHVEAALAAPHPSEPVVDEGDARTRRRTGLRYCGRDLIRRRQYSRRSASVCSSGITPRHPNSRSIFSRLPRSTGTSDGRNRAGSWRTSTCASVDRSIRKFSTRSIDQSTPEQRLYTSPGVPRSSKSQ